MSGLLRSVVCGLALLLIAASALLVSLLSAPECQAAASGLPAAAGAAPAPAAAALGRSGGRTEADADSIIQLLSVEEKLSLLNTNSPTIDHPDVYVSAFDWWSECLHGAVTGDSAGGTIFPQSIGLAASFDRDLVERVASAVGDELRAKSNEAERQGQPPKQTNCFGPVINIARDPRWGRLSESFGEDPFLTADLARVFVRGLQGTDPDFVKAAATCKHFAAYSLEEFGGFSRHSFDAQLDPSDVWDTYLAAWPACVEQALGVMCSYNSIQGTPACASSWLQQQLREGMAFGGFVVSDCGAIDSMWRHHEWVPGPAQAAAAALAAGTDIACTEYEGLREALQQGLVGEAAIDAALRRLLMARFALGHFDDAQAPRNPFRAIPPSVVGSAEHLALAREAAAKSFVLLKNDPPSSAGGSAGGGACSSGCGGAGGADGGAAPNAAPLLPLRLDGVKRITLVGPLANRTEYLLGSYYGRLAGELVSPYKAIANRVSGRGVDVGVLIGTEVQGQVADTEGAVQTCRRSDVCIFFVGTASAFPFGGVEERQHYGSYASFSPVVEAEGLDRTDLLLPGHQLDLVQAVAKRSSTPIVVVLVHGAPLDVQWLQDSPRVSSILSVWMPAQGSQAIADVLFGDVSPSGRLPVSFPFNSYTAQSDFYDMSMTRFPGRTHRYLQVPVLYEFGFGLSFISFAYKPLSVEAPAPAPSAAAEGAGGHPASRHVPLLQVSVQVANTGGMAADEVVLLFLRRFPRDQQQEQRRRQPAWQRWRWWQRGADPPAVTLSLPCVPGSSPRSNASGGNADFGVAARQALVGFERLHSLAPGQTATASFTLTAGSFQPFSPLRGSSRSARQQGAWPSCGRYVLQAGSQELEMWVQDDGAAVAAQ